MKHSGVCPCASPPGALGSCSGTTSEGREALPPGGASKALRLAVRPQTGLCGWRCCMWHRNCLNCDSLSCH